LSGNPGDVNSCSTSVFRLYHQCNHNYDNKTLQKLSITKNWLEKKYNFITENDKCNQQMGVTSQRWGRYRDDVVAVPVAKHWSVRPTLMVALLPMKVASTDVTPVCSLHNCKISQLPLIMAWWSELSKCGSSTDTIWRLNFIAASPQTLALCCDSVLQWPRHHYIPTCYIHNDVIVIITNQYPIFEDMTA